MNNSPEYSTSSSGEPEWTVDRFTFEFFDKVHSAGQNWRDFVADKSVFFSAEYLSLLEDFPASDIKPFYGLVRLDDKIKGVVYFQWKYIKMSENLRKPGPHEKTFIQKMLTPFRNTVVNLIKYKSIICGNLLLTGKYGYCFDDDLPLSVKHAILSQATQQFKNYLSKKCLTSTLTIIKDLPTNEIDAAEDSFSDYSKFSVQPGMLLTINPKWTSRDDYMNALKSKYRVRAKRAMKKSENLHKRPLSYGELIKYRSVIYKLYKNVSDKADFNAFLLHPQYFENLKLRLENKVNFIGYWNEDELVGFHTSIKSKDTIYAYFLGYNPKFNHQNSLYLNMLLDLIEESIQKKVSRLELSRTAIEIKSSVGAVPVEMSLLANHSQPTINKMASKIIQFINPTQDYVIRHPFREKG